MTGNPLDTRFDHLFTKAVEAAHMDTIDAACKHLQDYLGVTDGGVASIHFSDLDDYDWATMSHPLRLKRIREYVNTEISYMDEGKS